MKKILILLGGMIIMVLGCSNQIGEEEILEGMNDFIELHPTENLEDFFGKEGLIDDEFPEGDQGAWQINTRIYVEDGEKGYSDGLFVKINRNNREITGIYKESEFDLKEETKSREYPLTYREGKFELETSTEEINIENIQDFKLLVQILDLNREYFKNIEKTSERYVPQRPLYSLIYNLNKEDENYKKVMDIYGIKETDKPVIQLYGNGPLEGSSLNQRQVNLILKKDRSLSIKSSITFVPESRLENHNE